MPEQAENLPMGNDAELARDVEFGTRLWYELRGIDRSAIVAAPIKLANPPKFTHPPPALAPQSPSPEVDPPEAESD